MNDNWETKITKIEPNKILIRGYKLDELMGKVKFTDMVYLLIKGELPSSIESKMLEAILISSVDHGVTPPSCLATRNAASTGAPINCALASGILAINKYHGGAIEGCMNDLIHIKEESQKEKLPLIEVTRKFCKEKIDMRLKISGFGHRIHTDDPRTKKLFQLSKELGIAKEFVEIIGILKQSIEETSSKSLPINVDGALAAILLDMGFSPSIANGFFILSRIPGLLAHYLEELGEKPMRKIDVEKHLYTGHDER